MTSSSLTLMKKKKKKFKISLSLFCFEVFFFLIITNLFGLLLSASLTVVIGGHLLCLILVANYLFPEIVLVASCNRHLARKGIKDNILNYTAIIINFPQLEHERSKFVLSEHLRRQ